MEDFRNHYQISKEFRNMKVNLNDPEVLTSVRRVFLVNTTDLKDFLEQDDNTLLELNLAQSQSPARDLVLRL